MPVILKKNMEILGNPFELIVSLTPSDGTFHIKHLPKQMADLIGRDWLSSTTLQGVKSEFYDLVEAAEQACVSRRKIICYELGAHCEINRGSEDDPDWFHKNDFSFFKGNVGFGFGWKMVFEKSVGDKIVYEKPSWKDHFNDQRDFFALPMEIIDAEDRANKVNWFNHDFNTYEHKIEWTRERQRFFEQLERSMEQLILRAYKFLDNPEHLTKLISIGAQFLPPPGREAQR